MTDTNAGWFYHEAASQMVCAVTGKPGPWHPHHVVYQQELSRLGVGLWHPDNALRVLILVHGRHHNAFERIPLLKLRDENIAYAFSIMGARADNWLRRRYSGDDARLESHLARFC